MTILIVEDNKELAGQISAGLTGDVRLAESLERAKIYLAMGGVKLVILDLGLPDSQGINTLREIQKYRIPVVVLTANSELAKEASQMEGISDYIIKRNVQDIHQRIQFNINKLARPRRLRFPPEVFEQLKACVCAPASLGRQLTLVA